jgi:hypothetical protein
MVWMDKSAGSDLVVILKNPIQQSWFWKRRLKRIKSKTCPESTGVGRWVSCVTCLGESTNHLQKPAVQVSQSSYCVWSMEQISLNATTRQMQDSSEQSGWMAGPHQQACAQSHFCSCHSLSWGHPLEFSQRGQLVVSLIIKTTFSKFYISYQSIPIEKKIN